MRINDQTFLEKVAEFEDADNPRVGVLLIDEPESFSQQSILNNQRTVLERAVAKGWPIWFITLQNKPTHSHLRFVAPQARVFDKPGGNAFEVQEFRVDLTRSGVQSLILMGHSTTQCVRLTAVGGSYWDENDDHGGAVQYGYAVYTCLAVLSGGDQPWLDQDGVHCYSLFRRAKRLPPIPVKT